jgi:hypothetical protein
MLIKRLITVHEPDLDGIPAELRRVLSEADCKAIRAGPKYFEKLAKRAKYPWLHKVLLRSGRCKDWHLEFTCYDNDPLVPYFRFWWGGCPGLCLPRGGRLPKGLPPVLRHFYSLLGGFRENEFGYAGMIYRTEGLVPLTEWGGVGVGIAKDNEVDPRQTIAFLEMFSGDILCYLPGGKGAWYRHEVGRIEPVKSLERELAAYFGALLKGKRI